jgi:hypothetical protein
MEFLIFHFKLEWQAEKWIPLEKNSILQVQNNFFDSQGVHFLIWQDQKMDSLKIKIIITIRKFFFASPKRGFCSFSRIFFLSCKCTR